MVMQAQLCLHLCFIFNRKPDNFWSNIVMTNNVGGANVHLPNREINTVIGKHEAELE